MKKVKRNVVFRIKNSQINNLSILFKINKCLSNIEKYCKLFKIIHHLISHYLK